MRRTSRYLTIVVALALAFSMVAPAHAASKKKVYVCTKVTVKDHTDDITVTARFSYKKKGLLKKSKTTVDNYFSVTNKYSYGKKSRIKQAKIKSYFLGEKYRSGKAKFKYNQKGYVKRITVYNGKGKKTSARKITRNRKGYVTAERDYNAKGKLQSKVIYTLNKKGKILKEKNYNAKGKLTDTKKYSYKGNRATTKTYNAKGTLIESSVIKYSHGNVISETTYDETNDGALKTVEKYTYKRIKTSKASKVKKQQRDLIQFLQF